MPNTNATKSNKPARKINLPASNVAPALAAKLAAKHNATLPTATANVPVPTLGAAATTQANAGRSNVAEPAATTFKPDTADKQPKPAGGGYVNRAATKPQLYGADHQSDRDNAYLAFFASFLRGREPTDTITYAEIVDRQRPADMRNPLPAAGGKCGALDRGILSRFDKFGHTQNVTDPSDKTRRIGFRFTDKALTLAPVQAGMRQAYANGRPVTT